MYDYGDGYAFTCDECPICEGWWHRLYWSRVDPEYGGPPQADHCGCEKIGEYFYAGGYCEDAWIEMPKKKRHSAQRGRAYRRAMTRKADDRRRRMIKEGQRPRFWWAFGLEDGVYKDKDYIQPFHASEWRKYCKRMSHRAVRHTGNIPAGKSGYKKCYDYAWMAD